MYSFNSRVRYSETDHNKCMTTASIINYFQDCSEFESEKLGIGINHLEKVNRAWILCSWQVKINRFPKVLEEITISTWPYDFKGMYGYRNFTMRDKNNEVVACANSIWVLMDAESKRPTKVMESDVAAYTLDERFPMDYADRKLKLPDTYEEKESFIVRQSNLDMFEHVNNGQYVRFAQDYIPEQYSIKQVRVDYRKSAVLGDCIVPLVAIFKDDITVVLADKEKHPYAILVFDVKANDMQS